MSVAIAERPPAVEIRRADEWNEARVEFVRRNFCGGAPDAIAATFIEVCKRRGLSPEEKHAYLTKRGQDWVMQTGIDGYRLIADRTGKYAGSDPPVYDSEDGPNPKKATVTVWKLVAGQRCPFTASARWEEYKPQGNQGFMWNKMPYLMLAKCAEALALRKAFPAELSAIYTDEEMQQAGDDAPAQQPQRPGPVVHVSPRNGNPPIDVDAETGEIVSPAPEPAAPAQMATTGQRRAINELRQQLGWTPAEVTAALRERYGIAGSTQMTAEQADDFVGALEVLYREAFPEPPAAPAQAGIAGIPDAEIRDLDPDRFTN